MVGAINNTDGGAETIYPSPNNNGFGGPRAADKELSFQGLIAGDPLIRTEVGRIPVHVNLFPRCGCYVAVLHLSATGGTPPHVRTFLILTMN